MDGGDEATLFGRRLTKGELARRVGRLGQAGGVEPFVFDDGPARGCALCG